MFFAVRGARSQESRALRTLAVLALVASILVVAAPPALAAPFTVSFDVAASNTNEPGTHDVTVTLSTGGEPTTGDIVVTVSDAFTGSADGDDYSFTETAITFPLGSSDGASDSATVTVIDNEFTEPNETIDLTLAITTPGPDNATLGAITAHTVTIIDDDVAPVAVPDDYDIGEGGTLNTNPSTGVLANDDDPDGGQGQLTAVLVDPPTKHVGAFTLNPNGTFTYNHDGSAGATDAFTYQASDGFNLSPVTTATINVLNVAPVVDAGSDPDPVAEGVVVPLAATFVDPGLDDNHTATIDWDDGTVDNCPADCTVNFNDQTGAGTVSGSHAYSAVGVYTVTVTVDDGPDTGSDTVAVTVQNADFTVTTGGDQNIDEGDTINAAATFDDADGSGNHTATINWGDGTSQNCPANCTIIDNGDGTGTVSGSHTYEDDGSFTVNITVRDGSGDEGSGGFTVGVANVAPIAQVTDVDGQQLPNSSNAGDEGVRLRLRSKVTDPGDENFSYDWTVRLLGQLVATGSGNQLNYTTTDSGSYFVSLAVDDGDGGLDTDSVIIEVNNVAPTIDKVEFDATPRLGAQAHIDVFFSDAGGDDSHVVTMDWGAGADQASGSSPQRLSHTYNQPGTRNAQVCVTDDDQGETCEAFFVNPGVTFAITSDFNGDGREDLPIGVPGEDGSGGVSVMYGAPGGLTAAGDDVWKQGNSGILGVKEGGDRFGGVLAWGDFDLDGYSDLAASAVGEDIAGKGDVGIVHVIYGSASGLSAARNTVFHQETSGVIGLNQPGDAFGSALAAGDFNGDGFADLAVGVPFEDLDGVNDTGRVLVLFGSPAGLVAAGSETWDQDQPQVRGENNTGDHLGAALAAGDFDRDGKWELVAGMPGKRVDGKDDAGALLVIPGSLFGLDAKDDQKWHQATGGIKNFAEAGDQFGAVLAVGDFNGDNRHDLAVGIPREDFPGKADAGAVAILLSDSGGLTDVGNKFWHEGSPNVKGKRKAGDRFGYDVAAGDFNKDGRDDIAVGIPYQEVKGKKNAGAAHVLYGGSNGIKAAGDQRWTEATPKIKGNANKFDHLGWALRAFDQDGDGDADLAIGIPDENVSGTSNAGAVLVLKGRNGPITAQGDARWHQGSTGILEIPGPNDRFGRAL